MEVSRKFSRTEGKAMLLNEQSSVLTVVSYEVWRV